MKNILTDWYFFYLCLPFKKIVKSTYDEKDISTIAKKKKKQARIS
jgi:hypothetical protein